MWIRVRFSSVKLEKVVKPPHNPTIRNSLASVDKRVVLSDIPATNPIMRLPRIFITRVPKGIEKKLTVRFSLETRNLAILPINPPVPMIRRFLIIIFSLTSTKIRYFF